VAQRQSPSYTFSKLPSPDAPIQHLESFAPSTKDAFLLLAPALFRKRVGLRSRSAQPASVEVTARLDIVGGGDVGEEGTDGRGVVSHTLPRACRVEAVAGLGPVSPSSL
jgi:hypothetical protein